MRILVTGGSGYIGTRLMQALAPRADVEEIVDLDIRAPGPALPKVRFVERSVTEDMRDLFTDSARPVDVAMHLAWVLDPLHDAARQRAICIGGTERFLEGCAAGGTKQVFFMSSGTAYGAHPAHGTPVAESEPLKDHHHFQYSAEKREAEGLCQRYVADHPGTILQIGRPAVVGGPNVANYLFRILEKKVTFRPMGMDPPLQFVHEDDVAAALVAIVLSRLPGAFNIAPDDAMKATEAARVAGARLVAIPLPLLYAIAGLAWRLKLRGLVEAPSGFISFIAYPWLLSNRRLCDELGVRPKFTSRQTLESFLAARRP
ncbi:MAG: NAD-dependent epimerase/dehydratase family protein [Acidobacteriota bacterium]